MEIKVVGDREDRPRVRSCYRNDNVCPIVGDKIYDINETSGRGDLQFGTAALFPPVVMISGSLMVEHE